MSPVACSIRVCDRSVKAIAWVTRSRRRAASPHADGMKILVPELGTDAAPGGGSAPSEQDGLIDVNGADQAELESLPGIGPVTAGEIIAAREAQPFASVDDLRDRGVVGPSVFE